MDEVTAEGKPSTEFLEPVGEACPSVDKIVEKEVSVETEGVGSTRQRKLTEKGRDYLLEQCLNKLKYSKKAYEQVLKEITVSINELNKVSLELHHKEIHAKYEEVLSVLQKISQLELDKSSQENIQEDLEKHERSFQQ